MLNTEYDGQLVEYISTVGHELLDMSTEMFIKNMGHLSYNNMIILIHGEILGELSKVHDIDEALTKAAVVVKFCIEGGTLVRLVDKVASELNYYPWLWMNMSKFKDALFKTLDDGDGELKYLEILDSLEEDENYYKSLCESFNHIRVTFDNAQYNFHVRWLFDIQKNCEYNLNSFIKAFSKKSLT